MITLDHGLGEVLPIGRKMPHQTLLEIQRLANKISSLGTFRRRNKQPGLSKEFRDPQLPIGSLARGKVGQAVNASQRASISNFSKSRQVCSSTCLKHVAQNRRVDE